MPTTIPYNESYLEALQRRYAEETKVEKQAEIIRMAEKACAPHQILNTDLVFLERFFNLAFAAGAAHEREKWEQALPIAMDAMMLQEREACAKVCEKMIASVITKPIPLKDIGAAIRAGGDE